VNLLNGMPLSASVALELHVDGPTGFYMAFCEEDAEYFAARRYEGGIVRIEIDDDCLQELISMGALQQVIPTTPMSARFECDELYLPDELFSTFNDMREEGRINVSRSE
jgi:hypothetical protein